MSLLSQSTSLSPRSCLADNHAGEKLCHVDNETEGNSAETLEKQVEELFSLQ